MPSQPNAANSVQTVSVWDNDPAAGSTIVVPKPDIAKPPLRFFYLRAEPPIDHDEGTDGFRYWAISEALRRSADFWTSSIPAQRWQRGPILEVYDNVGEDLQADYDRQSLGFYHHTKANGDIIYSGESPDIACHEVGHAILDAINSDLWSAGVPEIDAFHESFGDMNAILSALQLGAFRDAIIQETAGELYQKSRLTRIAEQFGVALRGMDAEAAEIDCLRNAKNDFNYRSILGAPHHIAAEEISSNPHSFSRIFTGAMFEIFCRILQEDAADPSSPTQSELLSTTSKIRDIMAGGVTRSELVTSYFAQVAFRMVQQSATMSPDYPDILLEVFVRRLILSQDTAAAILAMRTASGTIDDSQTGGGDPEQVVVAVDGAVHGLDQPILVQTASRRPDFIARNGEVGGGSLEPLSVETAAVFFVNQLFASGQIDLNVVPIDQVLIRGEASAQSHYIARSESGLVLRRRLFHCGTGFCDGARCVDAETPLMQSK